MSLVSSSDILSEVSFSTSSSRLLSYNTDNVCFNVTSSEPPFVHGDSSVSLGANLYVVVLQVVHMFQHPSSVLSVLQQGTYIQHIVQVRLDLDLQLLALGQLQTLTSKNTQSINFQSNICIFESHHLRCFMRGSYRASANV